MPINLETGMIAGPINNDASPVQSTAQLKIYSPKFFNPVLTGNGQKRGMLNEAINPATYPVGVPMTTDNTHTRRTQMTSGMVKTTMIPLNSLTYNAWDYMALIKRPPMALLTECGMDKPTLQNKLYVEMRPHSIVVEETDNGPNNPKGKKTVPCYQIFLYYVVDQNNDRHTRVKTPNAFNPTSTVNQYFYKFTTDPVTILEDIAQRLAVNRFTVDFNNLNQFIQTYSLYDHVTKRSEEWQTTIDDSLEEFFQNITGITDPTIPGLKKNTLASNKRNQAIEVIRHIDQYSVPLDVYRRIYQKLAAYLTPEDTNLICRQNLNLLLSDTMENLNTSKPQLNAVRTPNPIPPKSKTKFAYSTEQTRAISSQEPLVLVQSGAGTGKQQPYYAKIATPTGWTTMGELHVGDLVIGRDGRKHKVLRIHEQGVKPGYELVFTDGAKTQAGPEHLWTVMYDTGTNTSDSKTMTTDEWLNSNYREHGYLPVTEPVNYEFGAKHLPLNPYFFGALIANAKVCDGTVLYTEPNANVAERTCEQAEWNRYEMVKADENSSGQAVWTFTHAADSENQSHLTATLAYLGLDKDYRLRSIPELYKTASTRQRKALLNGMFDARGDVQNGVASLHVASKRMAEDVLEIIWSLGLQATKRLVKAYAGDCWYVDLLDPGWEPFDASPHVSEHTGSKLPTYRRIASVREIQPVPMRCIEIDAPDCLYLTDDFIVTHNSTVILGRIDWMVANGVQPQDIMVLSFTNAAADHIKDLNPQVKSMTIAHMIHTIYSTNFPNHMLSELDTLANSLDIYFPTDDLAQKFKHRCIAASNNEPNAYVDLNNFIEEHYAEVMLFLDTTRQTSLELEIIVCYQKIDTMVEPPEIQSKHLIIDEVQDNSVFEFIYALKYVEKHKESLFIVGDCSQTLYEFRASNPRAMNVLEASGVFTTHQLQVNYRSNQEILDFANVVLQDIEANQYAQIQLIANSMATVTEQTFCDKVRLKYVRVAKKAEIPDIIYPVLASPEVKAYLDGCLARGEKIAFLAHTKQHVRAMEGAIQMIYPGADTSNMIPIMRDPTTVLSRFIQTCWSNIQFVPTKHILQIIVTEMQNNLPKLSRSSSVNTQSASFQKFAALASRTIDDWRRECSRDVNDWEQQYLAGAITQDELLDKIKESMLDYEIKNNKVMQSLKSGQNKAIKEKNAASNASFIFSTIHSAKGLEFDNVIVLYKDNSDMSEPDKRMYYVALTRAMKSELIFAVNTTKTTRIQNDYDTIVAQLHQTHPAPTATPMPTQTAPGAAVTNPTANQTPAPGQPANANPGLPTTAAGPVQNMAPANPACTPPATPATPATAAPTPTMTPAPAATPTQNAPTAAPIPTVTPIQTGAQPKQPVPPTPPTVWPSVTMPTKTPVNTASAPGTVVSPTTMSLKDIFTNVMPSADNTLPNPVLTSPSLQPQPTPVNLSIDGIQLPPGLTFVNASGQTCVTGDSAKETDVPGEQE